MHSTGSTKPHQGHDKRAIKAFLLHLAGELKVQQLDLAKKHAPTKLIQGVEQFRIRYGTSLLALGDEQTGVSNDPNEDAQDGVRQEQIYRRRDQMECVLAVLELLGELTFHKDVPLDG